MVAVLVLAWHGMVWHTAILIATNTQYRTVQLLKRGFEVLALGEMCFCVGAPHQILKTDITNIEDRRQSSLRLDLLLCASPGLPS